MLVFFTLAKVYLLRPDTSEEGEAGLMVVPVVGVGGEEGGAEDVPAAVCVSRESFLEKRGKDGEGVDWGPPRYQMRT